MQPEITDQPGHPLSLISLRYPLEEDLGPKLPQKHASKTLNQTGQMFLLGAQLSSVGFVMLGLDKCRDFRGRKGWREK